MSATIEIDEDTSIFVCASPAGSVVSVQIEGGEDDDIWGLLLTVETVDALIRALAAARVEIAPPTILAKPIRNPRQPNVPDNADALARVAMSTPERIDGDEK